MPLEIDLQRASTSPPKVGEEVRYTLRVRNGEAKYTMKIGFKLLGDNIKVFY